MKSQLIVSGIPITSDMPDQINDLSAELREKYVAEAAYYKSEKRGFETGFEEQDWLDAENEIKDLLLQSGLLSE
jgi:hypothetical protein